MNLTFNFFLMIALKLAYTLTLCAVGLLPLMTHFSFRTIVTYWHVIRRYQTMKKALEIYYKFFLTKSRV